MRSILKEVFEHRSRLDEEIVTIFLPDFSVTSVDGVVKCMMVGKLTAVSREQLNEMEEVLSVLRLGNCQPQQAPVKIPLMRKGVKQEDIARKDDNSHAVRNEIEMEEEAVEIDIEMTDVIWDLKEDDLP